MSRSCRVCGDDDHDKRNCPVAKKQAQRLREIKARAQRLLRKKTTDEN